MEKKKFNLSLVLAFKVALELKKQINEVFKYEEES